VSGAGSTPASPRSIPRLYAILDVDVSADRGRDPWRVLDAWLDAGVRLVQLRAKALASGSLLPIAERLTGLCHAAGAVAVINDRADIAHLCGAPGVHVGQDDLAPEHVRRVAPGVSMLGLSTHNEAQVRAGLLTSATYLAIGPVYDTRTKKNPDPCVGLDGVMRAAAVVAADGRPLVAIGGITLATAASVLAAGADAVVITSDLFVGEPGARAREYLRAVG
jgi:thiamine-phosphate pyrophosphorylase